MWFDGACAEVAATGKGQLKLAVLMKKWAEEHDDRASAFGGFDVDMIETQRLRRDDFEVVFFADPACFDANTLKHFDDTVNFFDTRYMTKRCLTFVEKACAEEGNGRVLACLGGDRAAQFATAMDTEVDFATVVNSHDVA